MEQALLSLVIWDWIALALRWLHVVCAIAWIGSSLYFIALDLGLKPGTGEEVHGEQWQVHGGGFYHIQKYLVAPKALPEKLVWFKWESYATWLSGMALMVVVYYLGAELYLVDTQKIAWAPWQAISISVASLLVLWVAYDMLCKSKLGEDNIRLMLLLFVLLVALGWGYTQIFTNRAAFLHLGAVTATIMSFNVFAVIIPNQKIVVADLKDGRIPEAKYGKIAKQRSTHNNYLTLPVLFLMLSNHYPLAYAGEYNWIIAGLVFLMGVSIRHYFNTRHSGKIAPQWTWFVTGVLFLIIIVLSVLPFWSHRDGRLVMAMLDPIPLATRQAVLDSAAFSEVVDIVRGRCAMCHAKEPFWEGIAVAPKGVILDAPEWVLANARLVILQSALSEAMPPANITHMRPSERETLLRWYRGLP